MESKSRSTDTSLGLNGCTKPVATSQNNSSSNGTSSRQIPPLISNTSSNNCNSRPHLRQTNTDMDPEEEDEYCVYTYKGDTRAAADLPSSFYKYESSEGNFPPAGYSSPASGSNNSKYFGGSSHSKGVNLSGVTSSRNFGDLVRNNGQLAGNGNGISGASGNVFSPDMDFLEMDFDPGGPGEDDEIGNGDSNLETETFPEAEIELLGRNLFTKQMETINSTVSSQPMPLLESRAICLDTKEKVQGSTNKSNGGSTSSSAIDITDGSRSDNIGDMNDKRENSNQQSSSTSFFTGIPSASTSVTQNQYIASDFLLLNESQPQPHCSKTLKIDDTRSNSSSASGSGKIDFVSVCNSCSCNSKYTKTRLKGSSIRSPTNQFSLRLVKSNTLPEMGRHLRRDSDPELPSTSTSPFPSVRTSGMSFSVPVIKDEPHFRAVINTNTSSSSSSKSPEDYSVELEVGSVMIWTIEDAYERSINQIGVSACGATAVCNVLSALGYEDVKPNDVNQSIGTRVRAELADLPEYLFSRSNAGATHKDLIEGIQKISDGSFNGRFFQPKPNISPDIFSKWLLHWICKGAVPVLTRNLQVSNGNSSRDIPDSWHHQMVFGVSPGVLFLSNPIECIDVDSLLPQLTSSSVLLIRRNDIICRRTPKTDLRLLARNPDPRWNQMNVLGQVANMILEDMPSVLSETRRVCTSHIKIPAEYKGGVTLFLHQSSPSYSLLMSAPDI